MNLMLWIVTGALAALYLFAGVGKILLPREKLASAPGGGWINDFSDRAIKVIGSLEAVAAIGLILPAVLDIAPILVPLAALGLGLIMIGAVATRLRRHEVTPLMVDLTYLVLIGFVVWGRFGPESFTT